MGFFSGILQCNPMSKKPADTFRVLHTADWHLGKMLNEQSREEEQKRFLDWLLKQVVELEVDVVLLLAHTTALADLNHRRTRHHIARREVLGHRRIAADLAEHEHMHHTIVQTAPCSARPCC